jgi:6-phosphogluconolactonase
MSDLRIYQTSALAARALADQIVTLSEAAISARGRFTLCLCGGSTPQQLYALLATNEYTSRIDWENVHLFWGDERCVPPEHADSNYHMARLAMVDHVPLTLSHVYRMHGELPPEEGAAHYERVLRGYFERRDGKPRFDLLLLGMGEDGHTASLFPGSPALDIADRWVAAVYAEHLQSWRLTLTLPVLNQAQRTFFLVAGANKAEALVAVHAPTEDAPALPVHAIRPTANEPRWFVDQEAARHLTGSLEWMAQQRRGLGGE